MSNPLQIQNKSAMIEDRLTQIFTAILSDYKKGNIANKTELDYHFYSALRAFYNSIGKPTIKYRPVWGPPSSTDWNDTMSEAYDDVQTLMQECQLMASAINESFAQVETQRQLWLGQLLQFQHQLSDMAMKLDAQTNEQIVVENFLDMSHYDQNMVRDYPADIIKEAQVLALSRTQATSWVDNIMIGIDSGNGFPGNTHQVRSVSGAYKFYGEDNLHMTLAEMVDGNQDTWFEYEIYELDTSVKESVGGYGFSYNEGIFWGDNQAATLSLAIKITFPIIRTINWLNISPFIPMDKGYAAARIKSIVVSDGKGNYFDVTAGGGPFTQEFIYQFPKIDCQTVLITLEQRSPYQTQIGHIFYKELESQQIGYLEKDSAAAAGKRVNGPSPSITNVQIQYDPTTKKLQLPSMNSGGAITNDTDIKKNLFQLPTNPANTQVGLEALNAYRYMVGIRDLDIATYQFQATSEYTSEPFPMKSPILQIELEAESTIPSIFQTSTQTGPWIQYFISIDEGKNWNPIQPLGGLGITRYLINSNTPQAERFPDTGYLDPLTDVTSVRVRIVLNRPTDIVDADHYTPLIENYRLRMKTEVIV